jgi:hypothetical protein
MYTWSDSKVCELATVCLPWQHWTKALVQFDDIDISFHSCVVVDLWQSLSEWHLLLSVCILVCRHENVGTSSEQTLNFLLNLERGNKIGEMLVQVYGDNAMKKTVVYKQVKRFSEGREYVTDEERSGRPATIKTEENVANIRQIMRENRRLTVRNIAEQVNIDRETVRKILTEDIDMRKV